MSFYDKLRNAFGFGPDNEYDDDDLDFKEENEQKSEDINVQGLASVPTLPEVSADMKAQIFNGVVEIFNKNLPDFLSRSVDAKKQTQLLADALDKGLNDYLGGIMLQAEQYAESKLKTATENALKESEKLRNEIQQVEQARSNIREKQLSADRQRRALSERVSDLEMQLAKSEAEREQFQLENRSLLNKLKVADLQNPDSDAAKEYEQKMKDLRTQQEMSQQMYNDLQNQFAAEKDARAKVEAELEEAKKVVAGVEQLQEQMGKVEELIHKRDERIARLKAANKKLQEQIEEMKAIADNGLFSDDVREREQPAIDMSAIEDEFECPDWFVSEPAPGEVSPLLQPDSDFGYQEPPKKPRKPENDAQLSLF